MVNRLIFAICKYLARIVKRENDDEFINGMMEFVKFGIVGISNTFVSYVLNVSVLLVLRPFSVSWDYFVGNIVSFALSVLWSFYWNNKYVFTIDDGKSRCIWKALLKTYVSYGITGFILANLLSWIWVEILGISKFVAPILNLVVNVPLNFILNKLWAFKE